MTVAELIERLKAMPQDAGVVAEARISLASSHITVESQIRRVIKTHEDEVHLVAISIHTG